MKVHTSFTVCRLLVDDQVKDDVSQTTTGEVHRALGVAYSMAFARCHRTTAASPAVIPMSTFVRNESVQTKLHLDDVGRLLLVQATERPPALSALCSRTLSW